MIRKNIDEQKHSNLPLQPVVCSYRNSKFLNAKSFFSSLPLPSMYIWLILREMCINGMGWNSTGQRAWWCFNISTEASHEWYGIPLIDMHFPAKARVKRSLLDKWSSDQLTLVILLMVFRNPKAKPPTCMKNLVNDGIYYHINWLSGFFHITVCHILYTFHGN